MSVAARWPDYLNHMLEAAQLAAGYVQDLDQAAFLADRRTQQAVLMNLVIVGEAATKLLADQPAFLERHPQVPWRSLRALRNRVAHGYFEVNLVLVWELVKVQLPELAASLPAVQADARGWVATQTAAPPPGSS